MAISLKENITLLKDQSEGKAFEFADGDETGTGKPFIVYLKPHDQMHFNKSYSKCTTVKFKRGRREEVLLEREVVARDGQPVRREVAEVRGEQRCGRLRAGRVGDLEVLERRAAGGEAQLHCKRRRALWGCRRR